MRVLGAICALILIYDQQKSFYYPESLVFSVVYKLIIVLGLTQLAYMFLIFSLRLLYTLYYLFTGPPIGDKWIHRNSP
ncbi:hypothetical protein GCM10010211_64980 [Streptomyces albospinus]|uniref:Uncharacterized protein n=1 Tax=Streptomyces albospinus TaxID=285515 RepID=A0ABQ2VKE6_9ACTN|nr:hypothetical protein GCM10010211_64980 [Streptomyces albospinus]